MNGFEWAFEDEISIDAVINWSKPASHDMLYSGLVDEEGPTFFYSIIGKTKDGWYPYYIGMTYFQYVSTRNKAQDHQKRLDYLKRKYPKMVWHLTLGKLTLKSGKISESLIKKIEGLLIYSNWHEELINKKKIYGFTSGKQIRIKNTGFTGPFYKEIGYGVFVKE